jgi:hypothetical protein
MRLFRITIALGKIPQSRAADVVAAPEFAFDLAADTDAIFADTKIA